MRVLLNTEARPAADFTEVLETACRSAGLDLDPPAEGRAATLQSLASRLHLLVERELERRTSTQFASLDTYLEHQGERRTSRICKPADPKSVADELCITTHMTLSDLSRLRREFALANHPDRAGSAERENATRRMMIANMIIDREMKRRLAQRFSSER